MNERRLKRNKQIRGNQPLFSLKYLFGEADITWNFHNLRKAKNLDENSINEEVSKFIILLMTL